jgi:hypothetical protein
MFLLSGRPSGSSDVSGTRAKSGKERGVVSSRYLNPCKTVIGRLTEVAQFDHDFFDDITTFTIHNCAIKKTLKCSGQILEKTLSP